MRVKFVLVFSYMQQLCVRVCEFEIVSKKQKQNSWQIIIIRIELANARYQRTFYFWMHYTHIPV